MGIFGRVWRGVKKAVKRAWRGVKKAVKRAWNWVKKQAKSIWNGVKALAKAFWNSVKSKWLWIVAALGVILLLAILPFILIAAIATIGFGYWIYNRIRTCPEKVRTAETDQNFFVVGHRGSPRRAPENTVESCEAALEIDGANAVEIDLCLTNDNEAILWHDWDPNNIQAVARQQGFESEPAFVPSVPNNASLRRPTHQFTLDEIRTHYGYKRKGWFPRPREDVNIPTIDEFFDWAYSKDRLKCVILDVKIPEDPGEKYPGGDQFAQRLVEQIAQPLLQREDLPFKVVFIHPDESVFLEIKNQAKSHFTDTGMEDMIDYSFDVEISVGIVLNLSKFSAVNKIKDFGEPEHSVATVGRPTFLTFQPWIIYRKIVASDIRKRDQINSERVIGPDGFFDRLRLIGWTINDTREMNCLIKLGIDGILTDRPARLRKAAEDAGKNIDW